MKRRFKHAALSVMAVFFLAASGGSAEAGDVQAEQPGNAMTGDVKQPAQPGGKKVSFDDSVVVNPEFPLLEKIIRDANQKLLEKLEAGFSKRIEEKLSRQMHK